MSVGHDARFALRSLLRNRVYAAATISTLALGVASVTVVYAIVYALLLAAPRYAEPDRIAVVRAQSNTSGNELPLSV